MAEKPTVRTVAGHAGRWLLGGTFAYAAAQKILDPAAFAADIEHFRLLPPPLPLVLALYLPWLELFCGAGVIVRKFEQGALGLIAIMCLVFFTALTTAWFRGLDISCGCFGHGPAAPALPWAIARSVALGLLAIWLLKRSPPQAPPTT